MPENKIEEIIGRLNSLQRELEGEIDRLLSEKRELFQYTLQRGRVRFERGMRTLQRSYRTGLWRYLREAKLRHVLTAPLIYALIIPVSLMDLLVTLYQQVCFRVYDVPLVRRSEYLAIDRHQLAYLNVIEKFNCFYCSYANGVIAYSREVGARTEQFWCPIKHARRTRDAHGRTERFLDYGDAEAYRRRAQALREDWSDIRN
ncbi:MAG: hypothetical protein ABW089_11655 [Sedimenticola sp.]